MSTANSTTKTGLPVLPASRDTESTKEEDASTPTSTAPTSMSQGCASTATDSTSSTSMENVSSETLSVLSTPMASVLSADLTTSPSKESACPTWQAAKSKNLTEIARLAKRGTRRKEEVV